MITDNLASLFAPNPRGAALPATYRAAVLTAFDPDTGANTVTIGTSELANVPFRVSGAEVGYEVGDVILVMYLGNSVMIDCKIATVGGPNFGASSAGRSSFFLTLNSFGVPNAVTTLITGTVPVPGWANSVGITLTGTLNINNTGAAAAELTSEVRFSAPGAGDSFSDGAATTVPNTGSANLGGTQASFSDVQDVVPGSSCTVTLKGFAQPAIPTNANAAAWLSCRTEFYRESAS